MLRSRTILAGLVAASVLTGCGTAIGPATATARTTADTTGAFAAAVAALQSGSTLAMTLTDTRAQGPAATAHAAFVFEAPRGSTLATLTGVPDTSVTLTLNGSAVVQVLLDASTLYARIQPGALQALRPRAARAFTKLPARVRDLPFVNAVLAGGWVSVPLSELDGPALGGLGFGPAGPAPAGNELRGKLLAVLSRGVQVTGGQHGVYEVTANAGQLAGALRGVLGYQRPGLLRPHPLATPSRRVAREITMTATVSAGVLRTLVVNLPRGALRIDFSRRAAPIVFPAQATPVNPALLLGLFLARGSILW